MNEFICVVNGVKSINFELLEEQYGSEFAKSLIISFDHALEEKLDWKLEVIEENKHWITFVFVTRPFSKVHSIWKERKKIKDKYLIGSVDCKTLLNLMNSLEKETVSNG